jgi:DNA-binding MarR family transcriptional regulator
LVRRERQTDDERVVLVELTEKGIEQYEAWRRRRREVVTRLLSVLDKEEQDELQSLIERILQAAEAEVDVLNR